MDTFNKIDEQGYINGKGIDTFCDTTIIETHKRVTTTTNWCSIPDSTIEFNCKSNLIGGQLEYDTIVKKVRCYAVGAGLYKNNKKEGVWTYSSENDLNKTDANVTFSEGKIQSVVCFSKPNENEVYLKAENINNKWVVLWLNPKTKIFEEKTEFGINLICDVYHVDIYSL